jgi:hypothetical protein
MNQLEPAEPVEVDAAAAPEPIAAPAPAPEPEGQLAEALFSQAVAAPVEHDQPLVSADSSVVEGHGSAAANNNPQSSLDMPAFLRRRRSLRDYEGAH